MTKENTNEEKFAAEYEALCKKYNLAIASAPSFVPRDDGSFSVVTKNGLVKLKEENEENKE